MSLSLRLGVVLFAAMFLASCQEDGPLASAKAQSTPDLFALQRMACEDDGGSWGPAAGSATYVCYKPTRDANKQCTIASDCQGLCLARSRTCAPIQPFLGCHEILTEGGTRATQCVN